MSDPGKPGLIRRFFRWLFSPSARWSIAALLAIGVVLGFVATAGTQVAVAVTGSNEFCGTACHSHAQFIHADYQASAHGSNRSGVQAKCADCHIPHDYPSKLIYKTRAGVRDVINEARGTISTKEKFEAKRWEMANRVWDEMKANNSANCRTCHTPAAMSISKQSEDTQKAHKKFSAGKATCIECHAGVAHPEPVEPELPAKAAMARP